MGAGRRQGMWGYAFPSTPLLPKVLQKIRGAVRDTPGGPLVAKEGVVSRPPGAECRAATVTASTSNAAQVNKMKHIHQNPQVHVWKLSQHVLLQPASLKEWQNVLPEAKF